MKRYDVKEVAQIIRYTLKQAFPATKFSVRLSRYSMGYSIDVHWTDGPTGSQVTPILDRFESKGFDGMTDSSYYCGKRTYQGTEVEMNGGYVHGHRHLSRTVLASVADRVAYDCGLEAPAVMDGSDAYIQGNQALHSVRVPFQWHSHWIDSEKPHEERRKYITMADIESPRHLMAHDSHEGGGEYLTCLIDRIAGFVSMEEQRPVELPEYILDPVEENAGGLMKPRVITQ